MTELHKLHAELKNSVLEGNWDKAIKTVDRIKEILPSKIMPDFLCKSYKEETGKCPERLYFTPFPGKLITIPCPFYDLGKCKIQGNIGDYLFEPDHERFKKDSKTRTEHYENLRKIGLL